MTKSKYTYKFIPNQLAKDAFNTAAEYEADNVLEAVRVALGKENYNKYMIAQDPLSGGKTCGEIHITLNPGEENIHLMRFEPIGMVYRLTNRDNAYTLD
jgi:hypothetical protein